MKKDAFITELYELRTGLLSQNIAILGQDI